MTTVRLTDAQVCALECAGVFDLDDEPLRAHVTPDRRRIAACDEVARLVNELSNHLDELAGAEPNRERRGWWRTDSRVLANLYGKLLRARA